MFVLVIAVGCIGQAPVNEKPLSEAERIAKLKVLLAPIHLTEPVAPIVKAALEAPVTLSFDQTPLPEVVKRLEPLLGGNIQLDRYASNRDEDGKPIPQATITYRCVNVSLKAALEEMLESAGLDYRFVHEGVEISDRDNCRKVNEWRLYPIPDILAMIGAENGVHTIRAITETVDIGCWLCNGGDGEIQSGPGEALLVNCSAPTHRSVAKFLAALRWLLRPRLATCDLGVLDLGDPPPLAKSDTVFLHRNDFFLPRLAKVLRRRHDFDIRNASVPEALKAVERTIGVPMKVNYRELFGDAEAEMDDLRNRRITIVRHGITARTALDLLREQGLHCIDTSEGLTVNFGYSERVSEVPYTWRYYPTGPLIAAMNRRELKSDVNQYLLYLVADFGDNTIPCFNQYPEMVVVDWFDFNGHLYWGPRIEHRRFELLYAGMREAVRRRAEILKLAELPSKN